SPGARCRSTPSSTPRRGCSCCPGGWPISGGPPTGAAAKAAQPSDPADDPEGSSGGGFLPALDHVRGLFPGGHPTFAALIGRAWAAALRLVLRGVLLVVNTLTLGHPHPFLSGEPSGFAVHRGAAARNLSSNASAAFSRNRSWFSSPIWIKPMSVNPASQ